jgi:hypothetical protein
VEAALLVAAHEYPELGVPAHQARMDRIAATLTARLRRDIGPVKSIVVLNRYLFEELGFRGNAREYYDPRNSFLNEVLDRKLGIPITLAIVYIEVGRHIGRAPRCPISALPHAQARCGRRRRGPEPCRGAAADCRPVEPAQGLGASAGGSTGGAAGLAVSWSGAGLRFGSSPISSSSSGGLPS